jgi:TRAP-type C4-dicarboxylate transport system substrate-binding protein
MRKSPDAARVWGNPGGGTMKYGLFKAIFATTILAVAAMPPAAARPIELKLAFFTSDRSMSYIAAVKPFIDAVNTEAKGTIEIVLHSGGVLGREIAGQPQVVLDGVADIAFIVPGYTPDRFPDNAVIELPGLLRDMREAAAVYSGLIAAHALRGYEDFFVIGAYVTEPETIHSRLPIGSIDDLKGKRIRVNNPGEAAVLEKLGAVPVLMQITQVAAAVSSGAIDGAAISRTPLSDYGIKRVATNHYFLRTSGAPLALVMNRKKLEALPPAAQDVIRKYSGKWAADRFVETYEVSDRKVMEQLEADPQRHVVFPSPSDVERARIIYQSVMNEWAEKSQRNRDLLDTAVAEIAKLRSEARGSDAIAR